MAKQAADSSVRQMGSANVDRDVPQAEGDGQKWEMAPARPAEPVEGRMVDEGPMARPHGEGDPESRPLRSRPPPQRENGRGPFPRPRRESVGFAPDLGRARPMFGEEVPIGRGSRPGGFDVPNWVFMDVCRAGEVAQDASWQACYPSVYLDYFTFIEDLFASVALSRLAAELGCDRLQDRA